jgi:hypothetical protein
MLNPKELKKVLKPIIAEVVKEMLFEEKGLLAAIINEVVQSKANLIMEQAAVAPKAKQETKKMFETMRANTEQMADIQTPQLRQTIPQGNINPVVDTIRKQFSGAGIDPFAGTRPFTGTDYQTG